jgi:hypothetical protein
MTVRRTTLRRRAESDGSEPRRTVPPPPIASPSPLPMSRACRPLAVLGVLAVSLLLQPALAPAAAAQGTIPVVRLPAADVPLTADMPVAFTIGRAEGADHEMFGQIMAVAFDASDNLYVLDRMNYRVMVYDRNGRFVRQMGSRGGGPGEFQMPLGLAVAPDGTAYVTDLMRAAVSTFGPDGTFLRSAPAVASVAPGTTPAAHPGGGLVMVSGGAPIRLDALSGQDQTTSSATRPVLRARLDGSEPVTLFQIPRAWRQETSTTPRSQGVQIRLTQPREPTFTPPILFGVLPGGETILAYTPGYTLRVLDEQGRTIRYVQRPYRPRAVTERDRERARSRALESARSGSSIIVGDASQVAGPVADQLRQMREQEIATMQFADTIPDLSAMRVSGSGTLWIERTAQEVGDPGPIDIVKPDGRYVGTVTGVRLPAAISRGGLAAYVERDDLDVARVVVRRVPGGWR